MESWLMPFNDFRAACRAVKTGEHPRYSCALMHSQEASTYNSYTVYIDHQSLQITNPWTKKFKATGVNRNSLKSFTSRDNSWQAKVSAYCWIIRKAKHEGLYDPAVCDHATAEQILNQPLLK